MSILITLLINLLVWFIEKLIEKWLADHLSPSAFDMANAKPEFIKMVKWRVWLGPNRLVKASKAYDLAVLKFINLPKGAVVAGSEKAVAIAICDGIGEKL